MPNQISPGGSRGLAIGTSVLMQTGHVERVEDLQVGDSLMGLCSMPKTVLGLVHGREQMYRIVPVKGIPYVVSESFMLSLKMSTDKCYSKKGEVVNVSVRDYLGKPKAWREKAKGWRVGVGLPRKGVPLDPYVLGVWLGDGHVGNTRVTTADTEVREALSVYAGSIGAEVRTIARCGKATTYSIATARGQSNPFRDALRSLGVFHNKHIPHVYKINERAVRLRVLAGLIDADGSLSHGGFDYISKRKALAADVCYVARSLGLAAYARECEKLCTNTGAVGTYYRVHISGHTGVVPCRLMHKQARPRQQIKDVLVTGIAVQSVGIGDCYGFELDKDGPFLLGDFTVARGVSC